MRQLRRTALTAAFAAVAAAVAMTCLASCAAPAYTYAADMHDHAYFKVPSSWQQVNPRSLADAQLVLLSRSAAGPAGGKFAWSRAYSATLDPSPSALLTGSGNPVVYASVQNVRDSLRAALSFDEMRDLLFPVTSADRQEAAAAGDKLTGFNLVYSNTITTTDGVRGINELFEYDINGVPDAFDQTVLTNSATTKLYLLLVQCYQSCFLSHETQIKQVVDSFTVEGS
jgi:hypothetical protein